RHRTRLWRRAGTGPTLTSYGRTPCSSLCPDESVDMQSTCTTTGPCHDHLDGHSHRLPFPGPDSVVAESPLRTALVPQSLAQWGDTVPATGHPVRRLVELHVYRREFRRCRVVGRRERPYRDDVRHSPPPLRA